MTLGPDNPDLADHVAFASIDQNDLILPGRPLNDNSQNTAFNRGTFHAALRPAIHFNFPWNTLTGRSAPLVRPSVYKPACHQYSHNHQHQPHPDNRNFKRKGDV